MEEKLEKDFKDQLKALCPLVDNLRLMIAAARHAFNRHSQAQLEEMARLREDFTLDLDPFFLKVEKTLEKGPPAEKPYALKLQEILTHLELMAAKMVNIW